MHYGNPPGAPSVATPAAGRHPPVIDSACTLVVTSSNLMGQWLNEIRSKSPRPLRVLLWIGSKRSQDAAWIAGHDVVITSYTLLIGLKTLTWIRVIKFWRVVLDESHVIKNPRNVVTRRVWDVLAHNRWCLSATPFVGQAEDLYSQCRFLRLAPLSLSAWWAANHVRGRSRGRDARFAYQDTPLGRSNTSMMLFAGFRVQKMLELYGIRHEKLQAYCGRTELLQLPTTTSVDIFVTLSPALRRIYRTVFVRERQRISDLNLRSFEAIRAMQNLLSATGLLTTERIRDLGAPTIRVASKNPYGADDKECPVCMCDFDHPRMLPCRHRFCRECLEGVLMVTRGLSHCPNCRRPFRESDMQIPPGSEEARALVQQEEPMDTGGVGTHPKLVELRRMLEDGRIPAQDRVIVFVDRYSAPRLIAEALQPTVTVKMLTGMANTKARMEVINEFASAATDSSARVLILSFRMAAAGLTLVGANHVVFFDQPPNPALYKQAMARVHRIGQTKDVKHWNLLCRNTVEESMNRCLQRGGCITDRMEMIHWVQAGAGEE